MERLMNGAFYCFLISQCTISFPHAPEIFDWIPVLERMQLVKLLDDWKYETQRMGRILSIVGCSGSVDEIHAYAENITKCWQLFDLTLQKAYDKAENFFELCIRAGRPNAPELDLEFWRQVYEHDFY